MILLKQSQMTVHFNSSLLWRDGEENFLMTFDPVSIISDIDNETQTGASMKHISGS